MNKQELIERIECLKNIFGNKNEYVKIDMVVELISELDEPEKVKIPQFVADWIEVCKEHLTHSLYTAMTPNFMKENNQSFDLILWIKKASNQDIFARAWLDGYEVEEEKRYRVKVKGVCGNHETLNREKHSNKWLFSDREENSLYDTKFTRKELEEANFGWVFDCEGIARGLRLRKYKRS